MNPAFGKFLWSSEPELFSAYVRLLGSNKGDSEWAAIDLDFYHFLESNRGIPPTAAAIDLDFYHFLESNRGIPPTAAARLFLTARGAFEEDR